MNFKEFLINAWYDLCVCKELIQSVKQTQNFNFIKNITSCIKLKFINKKNKKIFLRKKFYIFCCTCYIKA